MSVPLALGPLYAGFALSASQPVAVVGLGSSTMNGGDQIPENRWFNKLITHFQSVAPNTVAESTTVPLTNATITSPGIHGYNGGQGGTQSRSYLTAERVERIRQIQPHVVIHVVGSNDYAANINPADYYTRMATALDQIDAVMTRPFTHILIHAHMRAGTFTYHFNGYRDALIRLARERSNSHFLDVGAPFFGAGVPRQDSYNLLSTDNVHLTPAGHDFFYRVVAEDLTSMPAISQPQQLPTPPGVMASDSFDVPNYTEVSGRTLDNKLGGYQTKKWEGAAKQVCVYSQRFCRLSSAVANFASVVKMDTPDHELAATLYELPRDAALYFAVRRQSNSMATPPDDYRLVINPTGAMQLIKRVSTSTTLLSNIAETAKVGDRITLRAKGTEISVFINDSVVARVTDTSVTPSGWAGFTGLGTTHGFRLDEVAFSRV